jgi:hypothetical protein
MSKDPRVYLARILQRIDRILEYSAGGREAFFANEKTRDAVIRNLEIIAPDRPQSPNLILVVQAVLLISVACKNRTESMVENLFLRVREETP